MGYIDDFIKTSGIDPIGTIYTGDNQDNRQKSILDELAASVEDKYGNTETGVGYNLSELGDARKYNRLGLSQNVQLLNSLREGTLDKQLAEQQSAISKYGNAIAQAAVSEVLLGTVKGFSDFVDFISGSVFKGNNDYSNPVSKYIASLQESFKNDVAPIYTDPDKNIFNGGLADAGWWASNLPSVMSSLTLLIPSTGITKGLSWAGRALNTASKGKLGAFSRNTYKAITGASKAKSIEEAEKLNKVTKWLNNPNTISAASRMAETGLNASIMRTMENYQESRQVYEDMKIQALDKFNSMTDTEYVNFISQNSSKLGDVDTNDKEAVANKLAQLSADRTFVTDYINTIFDVIQLNALRNPIKLLKNMRSSAKITAADEASRLAIGKAAANTAEAAAEKAGIASTIKKYGKGVGRFLKDSGTTIKAELSEGVEEAVNYIAQEEGMHYGNVALGEDINNGFSNRLNSYMRSPELYDAAFWGVVGGVVFQGLGSGFNRISVAAERAYQKKKMAADGKTKEGLNLSNFQELFETSENKRRIADINARKEDFDKLVERLGQIEPEDGSAGIDPFNVDNEGNPLKLETETEKTIAKERAISEYITGMTFRAMDNGNFDMLKAYLQDTNVRQALEEITGNEGDGGAFIDSVIARMDHISDRYSQNLIALSNIARNVNIVSESTVPIEYLQIIARNNTDAQTKLEDLDTRLSTYEVSAANKTQVYGNKLDKSLNYKDAVQLVVLTNQLAQLRAQKSKLEKDKSKQGIGRQIELDRINKNIDIVENMLKGSEDTSNSDSLSRLLYATIQSDLLNDKDAYISDLDALARGDMEAILGEKAKNFKTTDEELMKVLGADRTSGSYRTLNADITAAFEGAYGLNKIDSRLGDDYFSIAALNIEKAILNENIVMNETNLQKKVNELHNDMLDARKKAIEEAGSTLRSLAKTYGRQEMANHLETGSSINWKNEADKKRFDDALEVLNLTSASNQQLYDDIQNMLMMDELIERSQEAANPASATNGESSTTSQNSNSAAQSQSSNNQSGATSQAEQEQGNTLNQQQNEQSEQEQEKFNVRNPNNVAAGTLVAKLQSKNLQRLSDDEIKDYLSQIDNILNNADNVSSFNKSQLEVYKVTLNKEATKRQSTNSSMGGRGSNSPTPSRDDNGNVIPDAQRETIKKEIGQEIIAAIKQAKTAGTDATEAINAKVQELNAKYGQDEEFKREINRMATSWHSKAKKQGLAKDLVDLVLLASSVTEQGGKYSFPDDFLEATKTFVNKFLDAANAKEFNGKKVVSFESMLRFANEQMEDPTTAEYIYNALKGWFQSGPEANNYIVLDNMDSTSILERAAMTNKELANSRLGGVDVYRVQIDQFLMRAASKAAIDKIQKGDVLNAKVDNGDIILMVGDIEIGRLPKPEIDSTTGAFKKTNNGWITDVKLANGQVFSELRKVWEDILLIQNPIHDKINNYIYQIIAANKINADTKPIKDAIENDADLKVFFDSLKVRNLVDKNAYNIQLIDGLVSIWNYIDLTDPDASKRQRDIQNSLDLWFNKLYDSYATINNANAVGIDKLTFKVAKISDGEVIQVASNDNEGYSKCTLGTNNDAFANIDTTELGVIKPGSFGVIQTTDGNQVSQPNGSTGSMWAILPNRGGVPGIVRGHMLRFMDTDKSVNDTPAGRIRQAISKEFERRIKEAVNDESIDGDKFNELVQFIDLCLSDATSTPLLAPVNGGKFKVSKYKDGKGFRVVISFKKADKTYENFTINSEQRIYNSELLGYKEIDEIDTFIKDFKTVILGGAMFNADFKYFGSDADVTSPLNGLATRDATGNFVITIPNGTDNPLVETFPSFKHFIMQNGGARWNTKVENGSNFRPRSETNQLWNQVLNVSIESASSRPVEENVNGQITPDTIRNGNAIDALLEKKFGKDSPVVKRLQSLGLIPSEIFYTTETLMKGDHPSNIWTSTSRKKIYVNDKFIETMNDNPDMAIRKLIHEQLHLKLHSRGNRRKELLNRIQGIVNDFENILNNDSTADTHLKEYLFKHINNNEERLEEFLVESLTNRELASYLNSKQVESPTTKTKQSIFDKILELLADIFEWKVAKGSLYEKELKILQGYTTEEIQESSPSGEQARTLETINDWMSYTGEHVRFDDDTHTYYVDGEPVDYSVTQYAGEIYGKPNIEGDYSHSSAIGRSMDAMYRDFFIYGDEVLNRHYPNLNDARKKQILEDLHRLRTYLDNRFGVKDGQRQYKVITNEFPLAVNAKTDDGNKVIAGTMDMLVMDADGNLHIFDFKAKNHPIDRKFNGKEGDDRRNYSAQQNMYRAMLETINPDFKGKVKSIQLIWMDTFYPSIRDVTYDTDDNGQVTVDGTPIEDYNGFGTPHLKENVEDSIISLEMSDNIEGLQIPEMVSIREEVQNNDVEEETEENVEDIEDDDLSDFASSINENTTIPNMTSEMQSIMNKAITNGTFMKAPNGNPTNLNQRQWLQVRTKAFKDWFGDWENNPNESSKVVDENGEPRIVYHSSTESFEEFKHGIKDTTGARDSKNMFFFSSSKHVSSWYTDMLHGFNKYTSFNTNKLEGELLLKLTENSSPIYNEFDYDNEMSYQIYPNGVVVETFMSQSGSHKIFEISNTSNSKYFNSLPNEMQYAILNDITEHFDEELAKDILDLSEYNYEQRANYDAAAGVALDAKRLNLDIINKYFIRSFFLNIRDIKEIKTFEGKRKRSIAEDVEQNPNSDGFVITNTNDSATNEFSDIYAVRENGQIKSATDNIGTFSVENNDIYASSVQEAIAPSISQFVETLPLEERVNFNNLILDGTVSTRCS